MNSKSQLHTKENPSIQSVFD
uniref:Uncharacterized protein n=1 Tax=Rhizophora mucronata TaxID=61149 RepID=A0A2P2PDR0_RHIMU